MNHPFRAAVIWQWETIYSPGFEPGKVLMPRIPVPGFGALAICADTEGNVFGLWEDEKKPV